MVSCAATAIGVDGDPCWRRIDFYAVVAAVATTTPPVTPPRVAGRRRAAPGLGVCRRRHRFTLRANTAVRAHNT